MSSTKPRALIEISYAAAAQDYLRQLPLEHFMEATSQATQRKITLESLDLVHARRPEVQVFNELLVQYPRKGERKPGQVVPDNMVVVWEDPIEAEGSYDVPLQPAKPFWVLEYVSKHSKRKDYHDNFDKYEKELKVPYFLLFYPESQELTVYKHAGKRYLPISPNADGRYGILELDLEIGLLDGWVRFWFQGALLPLPAELQRDLADARQRLATTERRLATATRRSNALEGEVERERSARLALERELERIKGQLKRDGGSK